MSATIPRLGPLWGNPFPSFLRKGPCAIPVRREADRREVADVNGAVAVHVGADPVRVADRGRTPGAAQADQRQVADVDDEIHIDVGIQDAALVDEWNKASVRDHGLSTRTEDLVDEVSAAGVGI